MHLLNLESEIKKIIYVMILSLLFFFSSCYAPVDNRYRYGNSFQDYKTKKNTKERLLEEIEKQKIIIAKAEKEMPDYPANKLYFEKKISDARTIIYQNEEIIREEKEKKKRIIREEEEKKKKKIREEEYRIEQASNKVRNNAQNRSKDTDVDVMDYWIGHHKSELIRNWGPPDATSDDGNNGIILIYTWEQKSETIIEEYQKNRYAYNAGETGRGYKVIKSANNKLSKMYYADVNGKIYHWLIK